MVPAHPIHHFDEFLQFLPLLPSMPAVTEASLNTKILGDQALLSDSEMIKKELTGKWISCLKNKEDNLKQGKSIIKTHTEITEVSDEELDALQSFCAIKINQIHCQLNSKQSNSSKLKDLQHGFTSEKPVTGDLNCTIPDQLVNRIHLKNISETMKQVKETKLHQPSQCHDCKKKLTELAKITFLRQKKTLVENALFQDKLEEQIYVKDSLTLIGEIHKNLPKLSEDPRIIWQRLNEKGQKV
nr:uncharacterized protein C8orf48 homolog isoform X2 [Chelonoidis abingdonii]